ncbi:MAG TPA: hypothetical protein GXZ98_05390 [Firmicutes bacterium]|jgi:hypothetical protein|nr:hypothetical protein [Bacillota bacterium]
MDKRSQPKFLCRLVTVALALTLLASNVHGVARVEPSKFLFTLEPGERITDAIKVTNTQATAAEYTAVIYDWTLDDEGRLVTSPAGKRADTLAGLIKFNPRRFKLEPGQSQYVRFTLTAPKDGDWLERRGIIFFEESRPPEVNAVGSTVVIQVGATVYLSFTETVNSFRAYGLKIQTGAEGPPALLLDLANEGQAHIRYQVTYRITGENGGLLEENACGEQLILPVSRRLVSFPFTNTLPTGDYQIEVKISFSGTNQILSRVVPFSIP